MPPDRLIFSGYTVLGFRADGSICGGPDGLLHRDTRLLSRYRLTIDGQPPVIVAETTPESDRWDAVLRVPRPGGRPEGPLLPQDALELRVRRRVGPGMLETVELANNSGVEWDGELRVEFEADFADAAELAGERRQRGSVTRTAEATTVTLAYRAATPDHAVQRGVRIDVRSPAPVEACEDGLRLRVHLGPGAVTSATLRFAALEGEAWAAPPTEAGDADPRGRQRAAWRSGRPTLDCADVLRRPFERAADDLFDLRNWELEKQFVGRADGSRWILNAGTPSFTGLFGRDALTAGWQSALLGPRAALGALEAARATQATADDAWHDAEPGKLIHELRSGPLTELGLSPRDAYYGTQTTPAMFLLALSELWHWTGDLELLVRHRSTALRALEWADRYGDLDGDGFLEYERRSPAGLRNQGWKDSDEAIRHADGSIVEGPVATVEEQAFRFLALQRMAGILVALGEDARAESFLEHARTLRRRWHEAYWMPDEGFYALALDGAKRRVTSITSNPGHALGTGIVPAAHAAEVADRLLAPDLFSGWGVRSLSDRHPSYNPFAYHLGAVWPVEQATFALGFKRYGLDGHLDRLMDAVFAAAASSTDGRLPEALTGHPRGSHPAPIPYPGACSPQAWSASAVVQLVQIMLGLYPFAPLRTLAVIRPRLPAWLPELGLRGLRVGRASVDLRFKRRPDGSARWSVERQTGRLVVIGAGPPDDVGRGAWSERLERSVLRAMPGRLVRAARIATGLETDG